MSPFLLRASSASGSVVLPRVPLVGSGFATGLGSMTAGPRSAPRSAAGGGSTRRLGVVAAVALGVGGQAWVGAVGGAAGDSRATGATTAADGSAGKAVEGASAGVAALWLGSRGVFSTAGVGATGTGAGATAGTNGVTDGRAEAGSGAGVRAAPVAALSLGSAGSTCSLAACF